MTDYSYPFIIEFPKIGQSSLGYISIAEKDNLPFIPKRIYWTYYTPEEVERGGHSHYDLHQILVAVSGRIEITTELLNGDKRTFLLEKPNIGLFIPKMCWRTMKYTHNAVQMCIASNEYDEKDYIREYNVFLEKRNGIK
ncbi:dTDP-6-deoxy-3,4-keto-hexulose isomerase [Elizabethkingia anophelis]|uniref:sugar 3,4-ketoisomerase n=1 Tax=Elizabethkingia anophelis TaxID=1117645 RepID=UPI0021A6327D|nr:FdtA/QdtA family cupin domain-containing protein [Elizabethkingia anophelis]MCT3826298.1 FdtA/QdtA family cupin domain-containing protein [Elizabethkingia anophelis]MCT3837139.1 FdtA/QdtA family cupin domain-containing protein [Elizabethkingia anophelis]MCT3840975.1 FdtA/QdtA family cupin domain-containing protein [Elizabethkingia anophelis]MCT3848138.1 FdtA/QdtA family cupin domain-containing protein [Elizabethkingia anophelis]